MLKKYTVEYSLHFQRHPSPERQYYYTDDPLAYEEFIQHLLEKGVGVLGLKHDGVDLAPADFDRVVKVAASAAAANMIRVSLRIPAEEERFRFGFSA